MLLHRLAYVALWRETAGKSHGVLGCAQGEDKTSKGSSRSRALYYSGELDGRAGNWADGTASQDACRT